MKTVYLKELSSAEPIVVREYDDSAVSLHRHSFFELVYVCRGKAEHILNDTTSIVGERDFFLLDPQTAHEYRPIGDGNSLRVINCLFLSEAIDDSLKNTEDFEEILARFLPRYGFCRFDGSPLRRVIHDESGMVGALMRQMLFEFQEKRPGYGEVLRHLLLSLVICLTRSVASEEDRPSAGIVRDIRNYVAHSYTRPLSLSEICRELHFSLPYVSSVFHRETGVPFRVYLCRIRIEKACQLLRQSEETVSQIATRIGYADPAFFYKTFRREMGMTPDEYRRLYR